MKKSILCAGMVMLTFCLLAGCGSSKSDKTSSEATTEDVAADIPEYKQVVIDNPEEYIKLGQYKGLEIEGISSEITDKDVEEDLKSLAENNPTYKEVTDRKDVKDGDIVTVDYVAVIDGKENEIYSGTEDEIEIGENVLGEGLDDVNFDEELKGHKIGETVKVDYTFPEDFYDEEVAGKKCEQTFTIKGIKIELEQEINDDFIKRNTDYNTVEEYKKTKKAEMEEAAKEEADQTARYNLWKAIVDNATQVNEFTDEMLNQEKDNLINEQAETAAAYGMEIEDYFVNIYGQSLEEAAKENLKSYCVYKLLEKELNIQVTDQDVKDYIDEIVNSYDEYASAEDIYGEGVTDETIKENLVYEKILDKLLPETKIKIVENQNEEMDTDMNDYIEEE